MEKLRSWDFRFAWKDEDNRHPVGLYNNRLYNQMITGSIPWQHVKVPWARYWTPNCFMGYVLDYLRGIFAKPTFGVLSGVVEPCLNRSCAKHLFLCCHDQRLRDVFQSSFSQPQVRFLDISHFFNLLMGCIVLGFVLPWWFLQLFLLLLTEFLLPQVFTEQFITWGHLPHVLVDVDSSFDTH